MNILDCTFRDGGYYTNWTFPDDLVADYLAAMAVLPIDVIELGLAGKGPSAGPFANINNLKARELRFSKNTMLAVMIDAKDYLEYEGNLGARLEDDLGRKLHDGVDIIRIAVHYGSASKCGPLVQHLLDRDYRVFLNLMQIDLADRHELQQCLASVHKINGLSAVYVADSLGTMKPARMKELVTSFLDGLDVDIGYHAHDNSGLAVTNAVGAAACGSTWLDCTVAGMGRGAGNASTEQLLRVAVQDYSKLAEDRLQQVIVEHFNPLRRQFGWGDNLFYQIGAANGLHPSFVQEILGDRSLSELQIFQWIKTIPANSASFDRTVLEMAKQNVIAHGLSTRGMMENVA
ncbi:hypothetical protein ACRQ1B_20120 [Rhizobium panacihumi]|uniref:hypothetical protein n=1 Tax=Rhizobium panacihumi TaxID=2008450 RepID=UPI003D7B1748